MQVFGESFEQRLRAFLDRNEDRYFPAPDRITIEAVRRMADICGDRNPVYRDPEAAKKAGHATAVAPPPSVFAWSLSIFDEANASNWTDAQGIRRFRLEPLPAKNRSMRDSTMEEVCKVLAAGGITSIAATGGEISLARYPHVDEQLYYSQTKVESISELKQTALGSGYFITYCTKLKDSSHSPVATARITTYNFTRAAQETNPDKQSARAAVEPAPILQPFISPAGQLGFEAVRVGQELPSLIVEVTSSLIMAGALFYNEEMDIHHDRDRAQKHGFRDIFMNTVTTLGLVNRFVSDWAGSGAVVEHLKWRLGRQQYPNDNLHLTGKVVAVGQDGARDRVTVEVVGTNSLGTHVTCQLQLSLPSNNLM